MSLPLFLEICLILGFLQLCSIISANPSNQHGLIELIHESHPSSTEKSHGNQDHIEKYSISTPHKNYTHSNTKRRHDRIQENIASFPNPRNRTLKPPLSTSDSNKNYSFSSSYEIDSKGFDLLKYLHIEILRPISDKSIAASFYPIFRGCKSCFFLSIMCNKLRS